MKKAIQVLVFLFVTGLSVGCASQKFVKNTYGTLASFAAVYSVEEPAREVFCKAKVPQPPPCVSAYQAAVIGWTAFVEGSDLLGVYIETKSATAQARIIQLVPEIVGSAVELTKAIDSLKETN